MDQQEINAWNGYLSNLRISHVRLSNEIDVLIWNQSKLGKYCPKVGYLQLILDKNDVLNLLVVAFSLEA